MTKTHEEKRTENLMGWVKEYGIEEDIKRVLQEQGYDAAITFVRTYFDGWGEADAILEQLT